MVSARMSLRSCLVVAALILEVDSAIILMTSTGPVGPAAAAGLTAGGSAAAVAAATGTTAEAAAAGGAAAGAAVAGVGAGGASAGGVSAGAAVATVAATAGKVALSTLGVGFITVGAEADGMAVTWDCWKPILHDRSTAPSRGRLLVDLLHDPVIDDFRVESDAVFLRNRWNESWRIDPIILPWGQVAAHASQIEPANVTA
eukprot:TRINITY_DN668_c3_g1_i3.p1 TRINITY_DN668_c3_g1~~TRINITY_DN668_c3_g1_i3.p1  ORF type:complete len:228 (-),score=23.99 TRINITY_DN668_c3_g1_i3:528-1130(-)